MLQTFVRQIFPRPPAVSPMHSSYIKTIFTGFRSMSASSDVKVPNKLELNAECEKSIKQLKQLFKCSDETAKTLFPQIETSNLMALRSKFTFLAQNGATLPALMEHCSLLNMPTGNCINPKTFDPSFNVTFFQQICYKNSSYSSSCHGRQPTIFYHF